ncbi:MAG: CBS domain-containing protein [Planctomycetes bacterium]|nr:CBS domain-containing protein [Planctomycetota bacterium]
MHPPKVAKDIMVTKLVTVRPDANVFGAIRLLIRREITGAPVVDADAKYCGVFSEKCCMSLFTLAARLAAAEGVNAVDLPRASDFMSTKLVTLSPTDDVYDAIGRLLKNRISGAPVVDDKGNYLGIFSERHSMSVVIQTAYEQLPSSEVGAFMHTDRDSTITEDTDLLSCAEIFLKKAYRRLPVLRGDKVVGQVSRRDVLRREQVFTALVGRQKPSAREKGPAAVVGLQETPFSDKVRDFMDKVAHTVTEDTDLLGMAYIFLHTPYRRLPVLRGEKLAGQVSRRDVLEATHKLITVAPERGKAMLYLSALTHGSEVIP